MLPLHRDPWFTFRFADHRLIPRIHLEGTPADSHVTVAAIDPETGVPRSRLAQARAGADGWVNLSAPLEVMPGDAFIALPFQICPESEAAHKAIFQVHQRAFGRDDEAHLVNALREQGYGRVALMAVLQDRIVGHIFYSQLLIQTDKGPIEALALAPLAVLPEFQRFGIGSALVQESLTLGRSNGHQIAVVLGDPEYYTRFGFRTDLASGLAAPFPREAYLALELQSGALAGVCGKVRYAAPFGIP